MRRHPQRPAIIAAKAPGCPVVASSGLRPHRTAEVGRGRHSPRLRGHILNGVLGIIWDSRLSTGKP